MSDTIEPIEIGDLTSGSINGTGAFDEIMTAVQIRLDREYDKNRIKGTEYSEVYLGSMQAAMGQAVAFLLGKDKAANEAALILAQVLLAEAQRDKVLAEIALIELGLPKIQAEIRAIDAGILKTQAETSLIGEQEDKIEEETKLVTSKILTENSVRDKIVAEISLIGEQEDKLQAEALMIAAQTDSEQAKISGTVDGKSVSGLIGAQKLKIDAEKNLLQQKLQTEEAQTEGSSHNGVIGKQMKLYQAQTDGFARDAEQKLSKIMADTYAVQRSTDEFAEVPNSLGESSTNSVIEKAKDGIGV